ncbi:MAG: type VI secretion system tube protein Hcp [Candidatus Bathyarchaeia archaeon]
MSAGPGASAGRGGAPAEFGDFTITKQIDKASPLTGFMSAGGVYISEVILDIGYVGETGFSLYYQYKLEGVVITNVIQTGQAITSSSCTSQPIEEVAFRYNKITWKYIPLIGNSIEAWWNLQTNEGGQQ